MKPRLLLVEDEPALARGLSDNFRDEGYDVHVVGRGDQVADAVRDVRPEVLVLDILLPGKDGLDVLAAMRERDRETPVILLTALGEIEDRVRGLDRGATDYVVKPGSLGKPVPGR